MILMNKLLSSIEITKDQWIQERSRGIGGTEDIINRQDVSVQAAGEAVQTTSPVNDSNTDNTLF